MHSSPALRQAVSTDPVTTPVDTSQLHVITAAPLHPAANEDEAGGGPAADRPNPLWAVNGAMAAFFFFAVMYLASH